MSSLLLERCGLVVTMDDRERELSDVSIAIEDGFIGLIGEAPPERQFDRVIDCRHMVAVPGLINTHHHMYQTLTRAFAQSAGQSLFPWLRRLYPVWAGLDEAMIAASTRTALLELLLSGCTTSADHLYVFPDGSDHFIDAQVEAARAVGMRFHPTRGSMDLSEESGGLPPAAVVQTADAILQDSERVVAQYHDPARGAMVRIGLAPCSPFSVTPGLMRDSAALARAHGVRLHTHIAETHDEDAYSRATFGSSPVELLQTLGWMGDDVWVAHCVHPSPSDIELLARGGASVAHCPTSNMLLGSGLCPVGDLQRHGVPVGLGVDGSASNDAGELRNEVKQALLVARVRDGAGAMSARAALRLATRGGAACLGRDDIGRLETGCVGDVALFDADALDWAGAEEDLTAALVLGSSRPHTVVVHGKVLVDGGAPTSTGVEATAREHRRQSRRLLAKWREAA